MSAAAAAAVAVVGVGGRKAREGKL